MIDTSARSPRTLPSSRGGTVLLSVSLAVAFAATACSKSNHAGALDAGEPGQDTDASGTSGVGPARDGGPQVLDGGGCGLQTCASVGASCGLIGDGCGNALDCGKCAAPQVCGGGGMPNVCGGSSGCTPRTCAEIGATCGPVSDGCGGLLECGQCPASQTCGGGGVPNSCGGNAVGSGGGSRCTPRSCAEAHANCGPIGDGCGGMLNCGNCVAPDVCGGGGVPSVCGGGSPDAGVACTNLCLRQVSCQAGASTTISGTVVAPTPTPYGAPDPLYNALVYIPNGPVEPFTPGVSCDRCGAKASGAPLVSAMSGPDGHFTLTNAPTGGNIPLVIQLGRWRRQVTIPNVNPCVDNQLSADLTRLPRNHHEGDIPLMAMVTGKVDTLECVLQKIGIDNGEFTVPASAGGTGRVQFFRANGANAGPSTPDASSLYNDPAELARYDLVLFACEGSQIDKPSDAQMNVINYANTGGRVFTTHYSYTWLYNDPPFNGTGMWNVEQSYPPDPLTGVVDQSFPKGAAFASWLQTVNAISAPGEIAIHVSRHDLDSVVSPGTRWIYSTNPQTVQHYTFNTPIGTPAAQQCGRVLFSDFHVNDDKDASAAQFPAECTPGPLSAQEKVLEFMLFDLASCIQADKPVPPPNCKPLTCAKVGANCGPVADGCGGLLQCGTCPQGQTCGGGGTPSVCGGSSCVPETCDAQQLHCGPAGDGCGNQIDCGSCPGDEVCGAGGRGICGPTSCRKRTCADAHANCGLVGDGCGGDLDCGQCTAPEVCGGTGIPNVCGAPF